MYNTGNLSSTANFFAQFVSVMDLPILALAHTMIRSPGCPPLVNLITEITEVANDAIGRELDKIKKEAIEEVAPGLSEKIKKIEEKIDKIESPEDLLDLLKEML